MSPFVVGYILASGLLYQEQSKWIQHELAMKDGGEGHSVSKVAVVLLVIFAYSFATWGLEVLRGARYLVELLSPDAFFRVVGWVIDRQESWIGRMYKWSAVLFSILLFMRRSC
jgi:hypothetical protein